MTTICPTVTAGEPHAYRTQMERIEPFTARIHVDLADGIFSPTKLVSLDQVWWRGDRTIDVHLMYKYPVDHLDILLALNPRLVIVHAEAEGNLALFADQLHHHGIEMGLALLPSTTVSSIGPALEHIDHALIFSGNLGHFGGEVDFDLLKKADQLKAAKPSLEIGWDGGINDQNAARLATGGIDVLNVGGFIQKAADPVAAYAKLREVVER